LADALEYAHERGLVHLDLKPSNVLLAADGQPMLLDFHLAQEPLQGHAPPPTWLGGTPAYMSPEQKAAVTAMREGRSLDTPVDGRSDIYSLGVLLDEALGGYLRGSIPQTPPAGPSRSKSRISPLTPGLEDLIGKCLQRNPADRYRTAAALSADLRRYLGDLPLQGVRNRSWSERWRKWRRRRPHALTLYCLIFAFMVAASAAAFSAFIQIRHRYREAEQNLSTGEQYIAKGDWDGAIRIFNHGLGLIEAIPFCGDLQKDLAGQLQVAGENKAARDFHQVADQIRLQSVADSLTDRDLRDLETACRDAWSRIHLIAQRLGDLKEEDRQSIRKDFFDLAVLRANLHVRLASKDEIRKAREASLHILEEAEATFGPSPVLQGEQKMLADALGLRKDRPTPPPDGHPAASPRSAWEHCALGRSLLQSGDVQAAAMEFKKAVRLEPSSLWPNYYAGMCEFRLGHPEEAIQEFSVCIGAAGQGTSRTVQAQILFNRALAFSDTNAEGKALEDYTRALELNPALGTAALNRGLVYFKLKKYQSAIEDLNSALAKGVSPVVIHFNQALIYQAQNNREAALTSVHRVLENEPNHKDAQALLKQLTRRP
jgi:tetratricopeptide (TPR) repeat protein